MNTIYKSTRNPVNVSRLVALGFCLTLITATPASAWQSDAGQPVSETTAGDTLADTDDSNLAFDDYVPVGPLPDWIAEFENGTEQPPEVHMLVSSEMRRNERQADEELWANAETQVRKYLDQRIAPGAGEALPIDRRLILDRLLVPGHKHEHAFRTSLPAEHAEVIGAEWLEWYRSWAELQFNDEFNQWAWAEYEHHVVHSRVLQTALFVLSGITLLGIAFGFLHTNHRTRGFYSGRLQTIMLLAILAVIALILALSNSFVWL